MNFWILTSLILTSTCTSSIAAQGHFENCCLSYGTNVHQTNLYKHVNGFRLQEINESCNIRAVIFLLPRKDRLVCGNPKDVWVQDLMRHIIKRTQKNNRMANQKTVTHKKYARQRSGKGFNMDRTHGRQQPFEPYQSPEGEQDIW